jgi:ABC-type antimicrobial peptide transport system permease subunit
VDVEFTPLTLVEDCVVEALQQEIEEYVEVQEIDGAVIFAIVYEELMPDVGNDVVDE